MESPVNRPSQEWRAVQDIRSAYPARLRWILSAVRNLWDLSGAIEGCGPFAASYTPFRIGLEMRGVWLSGFTGDLL